MEREWWRDDRQNDRERPIDLWSPCRLECSLFPQCRQRFNFLWFEFKFWYWIKHTLIQSVSILYIHINISGLRLVNPYTHTHRHTIKEHVGLNILLQDAQFVDHKLGISSFCLASSCSPNYPNFMPGSQCLKFTTPTFHSQTNEIFTTNFGILFIFKTSPLTNKKCSSLVHPSEAEWGRIRPRVTESSFQHCTQLPSQSFLLTFAIESSKYRSNAHSSMPARAVK